MIEVGKAYVARIEREEQSIFVTGIDNGIRTWVCMTEINGCCYKCVPLEEIEVIKELEIGVQLEARLCHKLAWVEYMLQHHQKPAFKENRKAFKESVKTYKGK